MRKIALVEDNLDNRVLVQAILEDRYEVVAYASGPEALEGLSGDLPDLILLDISLPDMDGVEVLRVLRDDAERRALPIVALTAHAMIGDRERYLAEGFDDYVTKPILDEDVLFAVIERWIGGRGDAGIGDAGSPA